MKHLRHTLLAWILAVPAVASSVSVSNQPVVMLGAGEALAFRFVESSYAANAALFHAPADPSRLSFTFSTLPLEGWDFEAELRSADGSAQASFDGEALAFGSFHGTYYHGPVSVAYGSMELSADLSRLIFAGPAAYLVLRNMGPDVDLGIAPYTLAQDMRISLSGGGMSGGGPVVSVAVEQAIAFQGARPAFDMPSQIAGSVPEPATAGLFAAGAVFALWPRRKRAFGHAPRFRDDFRP